VIDGGKTYPRQRERLISEQSSDGRIVVPISQRLRRVSCALESSDRVVAGVIPKGYCRPVTQGQWRDVMDDRVDVEMLREDRRITILAVAEALMQWADWDTHTTRPTWARLITHCRTTTGRGSRATIARTLAWLIHAGLIARVARGRQGKYAPGNPATNHNEAAVYVLLVPSLLRTAATPPEAPPEFQPTDNAASPVLIVGQHETPPPREVNVVHHVRAGARGKKYITPVVIGALTVATRR
jgi:hypothetical protein